MQLAVYRLWFSGAEHSDHMHTNKPHACEYTDHTFKPQNLILETGRDWVKSEVVLSSSPGTPELGTYFILILCWRDGQTSTGGRHEEGTRRDKGICKNLLESPSPKHAKITLRHEEISCEHATSYKEPQNHSMAWSGSAEGKELQQLVWILKYVWIKTNQPNTCSRPTNLQRTSRQPQSRNKAQSGSLAQMILLFSLYSLHKQGTLGVDPSYGIGLGGPFYRVYLSQPAPVALNPATTSFLGTCDCYEMEWLSQATPEREHLLFAHRNLISHGRKNKTKQQVSENMHPYIPSFKNFLFWPLSCFLSPHTLLTILPSSQTHRSVLQRLFLICQGCRWIKVSLFTTNFFLMSPLPW